MLEGKIAIVTGASRGIGKAIALKLAQQGANVVVNYSGSQQAAEEVVEQIQSLGRDAIAIQADVSNLTQVENMIQHTIDKFGRVDILVNNAGITRDNLVMRMKEEDFDAVINTNLKGVFHCIKTCSKQMMKQRSGKIINITSVVGLMGNPGQSNYVAAKAGVIGLTKSTAKEFASRNITVNAVAPGFITTEMTDALSDANKDSMLKQIPLGYFGDPQDIANAVSFLVSDEAKYITGQVLSVNGGMHM